MDLLMWPSAGRRATAAVSIGSSYGSMYSTSSNSTADPDASAVSNSLDEALVEEGRALTGQAAAKLVNWGDADIEEILELSTWPDMVRLFTISFFGLGLRRGGGRMKEGG